MTTLTLVVSPRLDSPATPHPVVFMPRMPVLLPLTGWFRCTDAYFSGVPDAPHHASEGPHAETSARPPDAAPLLAKPGTRAEMSCLPPCLDWLFLRLPSVLPPLSWKTAGEKSIYLETAVCFAFPLFWFVTVGPWCVAIFSILDEKVNRRRDGVMINPAGQHLQPLIDQLLYATSVACHTARVQGSHLQHLPTYRDPSRHRR